MGYSGPALLNNDRQFSSLILLFFQEVKSPLIEFYPIKQGEPSSPLRSLITGNPALGGNKLLQILL